MIYGVRCNEKSMIAFAHNVRWQKYIASIFGIASRDKHLRQWLLDDDVTFPVLNERNCVEM